MSKFVITGDWHIGKKSAKVDHASEFQKAFTWMIKWCVDNGVKNILHTGDMFDAKRFLDFSTVVGWNNVIDELEHHEINLFVVHGNHDVPNVKKMHESLFDIIRTSPRVTNIGLTTRRKIEDVEVLFIPYGHTGDFADEKDPFDLVICHDDHAIRRDGAITFSGHIHQRSVYDNFCFVSTLYQLDREQVDQETGFIFYDSGKYEWINNPRHTFIRVEVNEGKIEGLNPVKWVMNNRSSLAGANLEVKVDELTDKTLYQKLVAILETVALNDLVLTENVEFSQEPLKNGSHDVKSLIVDELSRPGAIKILDELVGKLQ